MTLSLHFSTDLLGAQPGFYGKQSQSPLQRVLQYSFKTVVSNIQLLRCNAYVSGKVGKFYAHLKVKVVALSIVLNGCVSTSAGVCIFRELLK